MTSPQRIIDLDAVAPSDIVVKLGGEQYPLPADVPVPDYLAIARLVDELDSDNTEGQAVEQLEELYERVLDLFRTKSPDLEDLPIGPRRLGELIMQIYSDEAEVSPNGERPTRAKRPASTRSTSRSKPRRSASRK